jgi:hypothetical protein
MIGRQGERKKSRISPSVSEPDLGKETSLPGATDTDSVFAGWYFQSGKF